MSIQVYEALTDEVTILRIAGRLTWGDGSTYFRHLIRRIVTRGDKWILIDLSEVTYIDSTGLGELVSSFTTAYNSGAHLKLMNLTKRVRDLLQITKLYTVYEVFSDEKTAIRSFRGGLTYSYCPLCLRFRTGPPTEHITQWETQSCRLCDAAFVLDSEPGGAGRATVRHLRLETYFGEFIDIDPGARYFIHVSGRLNRFAASFLRTAWRRLPEPRRIVLVLDDRSEVNDIAKVVIDDLIRTDGSGEDRTVVLLEGQHALLRDSFMTVIPAYTDRQGALQAFEQVSDAAPWSVPVMET